MRQIEKLNLVARTDSTFTSRGALWVGKCLICNGPIAFDAKTGEGATLEHIRARSRGGSDDAENLARRKREADIVQRPDPRKAPRDLVHLEERMRALRRYARPHWPLVTASPQSPYCFTAALSILALVIRPGPEATSFACSTP